VMSTVYGAGKICMASLQLCSQGAVLSVVGRNHESTSIR
jgi:hypothetical protein